eukprot:gene24835-31223_t
MIQPSIPPVKIPYLRSLTYIVVASVDHGDLTFKPWSSILFGDEGFVSVSQDGRTILINNARVANLTTDPLVTNLQKSCKSPLSIMAINFEVRNRYRINGHAVNMACKNGLLSFSLQVEEAFGNCPKYIQAQHTDGFLPASSTKLPPMDGPSSVQLAKELTLETAALISKCEAMFVSYTEHNTSNRVRDTRTDITHRGGSPGFVRVLSRTELAWPDYAGNNMFMTLGNMVVFSGTGLLFIDFANERYLQVTGTATVHVNSGSTADSGSLQLTGEGLVAPSSQQSRHNYSMDGSNRYVLFAISEVRAIQSLPSGYFQFVNKSPFNVPISGFRGHLSGLFEDHSSRLSKSIVETQNTEEAREMELTLSIVRFLSSSVAQFHFTLSHPFEEVFYPGQFATVHIQLPYANNDNAISDTLTAVEHNASRAITAIEFTIKLNAVDGYVSKWLHSLAHSLHKHDNNNNRNNVVVNTAEVWRALQQQYGLSFVLRGFGGDFSIYNTNHMPTSTATKKNTKTSNVLSRSVEECSGKILLLSGGIGVTPSLVTIHSIFAAQNQQKLSDCARSGASQVTCLDVVLVATFRTIDESSVLSQLLPHFLVNNASSSVKLSIHVIITTPQDNNTNNITNNNANSVTKHKNVKVTYGSRLTLTYLTTHISDLTARDSYLCGPDVFMHTMSEGLVECGVQGEHVHMEDFHF